MNLTPHFTVEELTRSDTAIRLCIDQTPQANVLQQLLFTAQQLEIVRELLGHPLHINSGYRSLKLNTAVGGAPNSAHLTGRAADFTCPEYGTPQQIVKFLSERPEVKFDQLIYEGTWVHIGFADNPRREVLTAHFGGKTHYTVGIE